MKMTENSVLPCTAMLLQRSDSSEGGPEALSGCDRREGHKKAWGTSLVVRWLRLCAPNAGGTVSSPSPEDPTYCGATKPVRHNY